MYKILTSLFFIFITFSIAADDTYVFEAKGEFAKELKALVEKYSKEGKIEAKVYTKGSADDIVTKTEQTGAMVSVYDGEYMQGEELYKKKCSTCHGIKGEESPGYRASAMTNMSKEDMQRALREYRNDMQFGGGGKMLMQNVVQSLTENQGDVIIDYVLGINKESSKNNNKQEEGSAEVPTSYLQ